MLEGLAVAIANVDEMIELIKASPTPPIAKRAADGAHLAVGVAREMLERAGADDYKPEGSSRRRLCPDGTYRLSDVQAQEILQMRLQRLTGLEQDKIVQEYREVIDTITDLLDILARPERITAIIATSWPRSAPSSATQARKRRSRSS
jgi:DNA gyrase subunit A